MKTVSLPNKHPLFAKALYWGKLVTITGGAQVIIQGVGVLAGILIIRLLPTEEYAYYTLANTMLGVMTMLSDGGISNGVTAQGGKVWQDKARLGVVLASGLALRKKFAIGALSVSLPILAFLLHRNGAGWLTTLLIVAALVPGFLATLSDMILEVGPKLHQQINPLQKNQAEVSLLRLFLSGVSLFIFPFTATALLVNGITRIYGNRRLMKFAYLHADKDSKADAAVEKDILNAVKRILPPTLYYCFSSQIIIWIPSMLGNTTGVAQIGALSRLSMVLNLFSFLVSILILPRFARIDSHRHDDVLKLFTYVQLMLISMSLCIIAVFYTFPAQFLWILGDSYSNLSRELSLMIVSSSIGLLSNLTAQLIGSRGWFVHPLIIIGINILSIVISYYAFNLSQITGVLYYDILLNSIAYLSIISYGLIRMKRPAINAV